VPADGIVVGRIMKAAAANAAIAASRAPEECLKCLPAQARRQRGACASPNVLVGIKVVKTGRVKAARNGVNARPS